MRDPELVFRAQLAASGLERAWQRWRMVHGLTSDPMPAISSYVGYSLEEPWGQPRVVFGLAAQDAEQLMDLLDRHDCVGPVHAGFAARPDNHELNHQPELPARQLPVPPQSPSAVADESVPVRAGGPRSSGSALGPRAERSVDDLDGPVYRQIAAARQAAAELGTSAGSAAKERASGADRGSENGHGFSGERDAGTGNGHGHGSGGEHGANNGRASDDAPRSGRDLLFGGGRNADVPGSGGKLGPDAGVQKGVGKVNEPAGRGAVPPPSSAAGTAKPADTAKAAETTKAADTAKAAETAKASATPKPGDMAKASATPRIVGATKAAQAAKASGKSPIGGTNAAGPADNAGKNDPGKNDPGKGGPTKGGPGKGGPGSGGSGSGGSGSGGSGSGGPGNGGPGKGGPGKGGPGNGGGPKGGAPGGGRAGQGGENQSAAPSSKKAEQSSDAEAVNPGPLSLAASAAQVEAEARIKAALQQARKSRHAAPGSADSESEGEPESAGDRSRGSHGKPDDKSEEEQRTEVALRALVELSEQSAGASAPASPPGQDKTGSRAEAGFDQGDAAQADAEDNDEDGEPGDRPDHPPGSAKRKGVARGYSMPRLPRPKKPGTVPGT